MKAEGFPLPARNKHAAPPAAPGLQPLLDALGQAVLIFDAEGRLTASNVAARALIGDDLRLIEAAGWSAATALLDSHYSRQTTDETLAQAIASGAPARFQVYLNGQVHSCWVAAAGDDAAPATVISIEVPDWAALTELMDRFIGEMREAVDATQGHADLILQTLTRARPDAPAAQLSRRMAGFTRLIGTHMYRANRLLEQMTRLEDIRLGQLRGYIDQERRAVRLEAFVEDVVESLDDARLLDPETDAQDLRARVRVDISPRLAVSAAPRYLAGVLRELIRNAIMYSMRATPVTLHGRVLDGMAQIDVIDEGYGIRASEYERVFAPFQRARQPQVMGEFGYGLSLFLCKHEIEAMNGRLWFQSEEGVGATFSLMLPTGQTDSRGSGSSSANSQL